jgi:hypothetical protein
MTQTPLEIQFYHQRFDKLADFDEMLYGSDTQQPERECDNCGKRLALRDCYSVTPIKWESWDQQMYKNFGPIRCVDCIPSDSIEASEWGQPEKAGGQK